MIDTPISESGFVGAAVGAAMTGMRPVVEIMFIDFTTCAMDMIVNQMAKIHYMFGGTGKGPDGAADQYRCRPEGQRLNTPRAFMPSLSISRD